MCSCVITDTLLLAMGCRIWIWYTKEVLNAIAPASCTNYQTSCRGWYASYITGDQTKHPRKTHYDINPSGVYDKTPQRHKFCRVSNNIVFTPPRRTRQNCLVLSASACGCPDNNPPDKPPILTLLLLSDCLLKACQSGFFTFFVLYL